MNDNDKLSISALRRAQARLYRQARGGALAISDAAKRIAKLSAVRQSIEQKLKRRLAEIDSPRWAIVMAPSGPVVPGQDNRPQSVRDARHARVN